MSDDHHNNDTFNPYGNSFYYHDYLGNTGGNTSTFPFFGGNHPMMYNVNQSSVYHSDHHHHPPPSYTSFTDCLQGSASDYNAFSGAFDKSCNNSSSENQNTCTTGAAAGTTTTTTSVENLNSSVSCSSNEAGEGGGGGGGGGEEEESSKKSNTEIRTKGGEAGDDKSKKLSKQKKKGEKKPREPRFAFMTKSEIDNLEDGYRWRKYGQKAVKNSPFPRSYYRCTSQKCSVKKRVERSFQDPTVVITTYEGQHNHHCPATLRGNAAAMLSSSFLTSSPPNPSSSSPVLFPGFTSDFLSQNPYYQNLINNPQLQLQQQHFQHPQDYNFFPEMNPSLFMPKHEP